MCRVLPAVLITGLPIETQQNQRIVISNHVGWTVETPMLHLLENSVLVAMASSAWYSLPQIEGILSVMNFFNYFKKTVQYHHSKFYEFRSCWIRGLCVMFTSTILLVKKSRKIDVKMKKCCLSRLHPADWHIYLYMYFVHIYGTHLSSTLIFWVLPLSCSDTCALWVPHVVVHMCVCQYIPIVMGGFRTFCY